MNIVPVEKRIEILERLATGETITNLAKEHDIARSTIYRWRNTAENLAILRDNIITNLMSGINDVSNIIPELVTIQLELARDEMVKPSDRLKACDQLTKMVSLGVSQMVAVEVAEIREQLKNFNEVDNSDAN